MSLPVKAEEIVVDSRIMAATVYNDRATLTRSAKVQIPAGAHTLIFKGLPLNIFTDSLRAQGSSSADVVFGALEYKQDSSEDFIVPREKELNAQIETLEDEKKVYNADKHALVSARTFLENMGKTASLRENEEIAKLELKPEAWANAADGLASKLSENLKADLALDIKVRDNQRKIENLRNELRGLRTGQKQSYSVSLPLEVSEATTLGVDLLYQISNVSWQPMYDARLDVKSGKLDIVQYGALWQRTGEDWDDVKLTLSTAQPSRGAGLPDLSSQWISLYQETYNRARKQSFGSNLAGSASPMMAMESVVGADSIYDEDKQMEPMQEAQFQSAQINTEGFVGEYVIPGPVDVKSDGTKAKVLIGSFETENTLEVQVKPQLDTRGYLVAKATLMGDAPILPGSVNLFRDGAYIGQSYTDMLRPGDEAYLAFGIDDNVTLTRNILVDNLSEAGMISKSNVRERGYVTRIKNLHKQPISLAVLETIPASTDEKISVSVLKEKTTQGYESDVDDVIGLLRWSIKLEPKKEAEVKLGWQVSWPKDDVISGL
jgi:uncharacterized protein (TIGR02231 family)